MNEIIAKKLNEQLRVLGIFLRDYNKELNKEILGEEGCRFISDAVAFAKNRTETFLNK